MESIRFACAADGWRPRLRTPARCIAIGLAVLAGQVAEATAPVPGAALFPLDRTAYETCRSENALVLSGVVAGDRGIGLQLERFDVFSEDARVVVGAAAGDVPMDFPPVALFRGHVVDEPASSAYVSVSPFGVYGFVETATDSFIISSGPATQQSPTLIYSLGALPEGTIRWADFTCGADTLPSAVETDSADAARASSGPTRDAPCRVAKIAIDTDTEFTTELFGGDTSASAAYATALLGAVSEIYRRDLNTRLTLSYLRVWNTDDPWTATDINSQLSQFVSYWYSHMQSVSRHAAHLICARTFPDWYGVAYMSALCKSSAYGLSSRATGFFPYPLEDHREENHDIIIVAHELGHNFGAQHTHDLTPPVDPCGLGDCSNPWGGTIMSYCHRCPPGFVNDELRFHERSVSENMLPYLASLTSCDLDAAVHISAQPTDVVVTPGQAATFTVSASASYGALSYQWRRDDVALADGERVTGTTTPTISIDPVHRADAGRYDVVVSNDCGGVTSARATLTVVVTLGDMNCDAAVNNQDVDGFVLALFDTAAYAAAYPGCQWLNADFSGDGWVNNQDIDGFIVALFQTFPRGDMDCNGTVNNQDISGFVAALLRPDTYPSLYPTCNMLNGDFNDDGLVNNQDISGFLLALFGG